ncbi:hypothetical protein [Candidatus Poriferisodalis sp.]|uniref:hypothetical protein n=1 Tax=Candidatus Poriferisodalis sp. TaxID=3101277 RepID=UPI003B51E334
MADDIDTGTISPPQSPPADTVEVHGLTESELGAHVNRLLASVGEATSGASSGVASLAAVWVISQIEEACGAGTLVDPRDLTKDDFATPAALSQMLHRQIRERVAPLVKS